MGLELRLQLGNIYTWSHYNHLMWQYDGVDKWGQLKQRLCMCRCEGKILRKGINGYVHFMV